VKWKIGNVEIENQVCLAPMAGICNNSFRKIVKEMGCGLIYTEMISDKAIVYGNKKTIDMLYVEEFERPITMQIFGNEKASFVSAAKYIYENIKPDIIDINMGCPVPKVAVRSQAGAALLKDVNKIYDLVCAVVNAVPCPITVKIRSGWDSNNINAIEVAKVCEKAGAKAICIHPRTRAQGYTGKADWNIIKEVKANVSIPVIGNGDITDVYLAKKMLDETKCDAIMIGRGALGNPWLIKQVITYLDNKRLIEEPDYKDKINMCMRHLDYLFELKGEKLALLEIRSHAAWYIKGLNDATPIKKKIYSAESIEQVKMILNEYLKELDFYKIEKRIL
jgi:tRNA-dihydrouridine synthase B